MYKILTLKENLIWKSETWTHSKTRTISLKISSRFRDFIAFEIVWILFWYMKYKIWRLLKIFKYYFDIWNRKFENIFCEWFRKVSGSIALLKGVQMFIEF